MLEAAAQDLQVNDSSIGASDVEDAIDAHGDAGRVRVHDAVSDDSAGERAVTASTGYC